MRYGPSLSRGKARIAAGCPGGIPQDFRRTVVERFNPLGVSRGTAMQLTGRRTELVYRRYGIVDKEDLRDAVRRLDSEGSTVNRYSDAVEKSTGD